MPWIAVAPLALTALISNFAFAAGPDAACMSGSGLTEVIPLEGDIQFGMYTRIHPRGDYIIGTGNGSFIVDLRQRGADGIRRPRLINTTLNAEAYPTEGSWSFVASSKHHGGGGPDTEHMKMYDFRDLVATSGEAPAITAKNLTSGQQEQFTDTHVNNWYQTAADLPSTNPNVKRFRLVQYASLEYSDFETQVDASGHVISYRKTASGHVCRNLGITDSSTPILSKDGTEIAMYTNHDGRDGTFIFKIGENGNCSRPEYVGPTGEKGNFSYPKAGSRGRYVYIGQGNDPQGQRRSGVVVYNRDNRRTEWVETTIHGAGGRDASYSFPGFMRDGRIMVGQTLDSNRALIVTKSVTGAAPAVCEDCRRAAEAQASNVEKLGRMWQSVCARVGGDQTPLRLTAGKLPLDVTSCRAMVKKHYDRKVREHVIAGVTQANLLAVCNLGGGA